MVADADRRPTAGPMVKAIVRHDDRKLINAATRAVDASLSLTSGAAVSTSLFLCLFDPEHSTTVARPQLWRRAGLTRGFAVCLCSRVRAVLLHWRDA